MNSKYVLAYTAQLFGVFLLFMLSGPARLVGIAAICAGGIAYRRQKKRAALLSGPIEHKASMLQRLLLKSLAIVFLLPPTAAACYGVTWLLMLAVGATRGDLSLAPASPVAFTATVLLGCFGLQSLWGLYFHFVSDQDPPQRKLLYWIGLCSAVTASAYLTISIGGSLLFKVLFFGWVLVPTMFFVVMLLRQRVQPNNSFKPKPLRGSA